MGVRKMKHQMFPPNQSDNSFEWFRNQHRINEKYYDNGFFNPNELGQYPIEQLRYYGNTIQPYTHNQMQQPSFQPQTGQISDISQFGGPPFMNSGNTMEEINFNGLSGQGTMFSNPMEFQYGQPTNYPTLQQHLPGYAHNTMMHNPIPQNQNFGIPFGNQMNYYPQNQNFISPQSHQHQMMQGGPFTASQMFTPSTPYPTQPKQLNHQNNNGQSFQLSTILNQFKNSSGSYDVPKMMSTAGQVMNTMNQVGGLFKQIGVFFK
jgi:YppG-like protein